MTKERIEERTDDDTGGLDTTSQNIAPISDREEVRGKIMQRYDADKSIIQPPSSTDQSLGDAIRAEIQKRK